MTKYFHLPLLGFLVMVLLSGSTTAFTGTSTSMHHLQRTSPLPLLVSDLHNTRLYLLTEDKKTQAEEMQATPKDDSKTSLDPKEKMTQMMKPIKEAGVAGAVSLFLWEAAFWIISIPVCSIAYYKTTGSWPDWSNAEDVAKVSAEAFAFANIARFALPLRVGLAVATTPWVQANLIDRFAKKDD